MKPILVVLFLSLFNGILFAQVPEGRYFNSINGSTWRSGIVDEISIKGDKAFFGLTLVEPDSIDTSSTLWIFEDRLTIVHYDSNKRENETMLNCDYIHDTENHTLTLIVKDKQLVFEYTSVSTGAFVTLSKKRK